MDLITKLTEFKNFEYRIKYHDDYSGMCAFLDKEKRPTPRIKPDYTLTMENVIKKYAQNDLRRFYRIVHDYLEIFNFAYELKHGHSYTAIDIKPKIFERFLRRYYEDSLSDL